MGKRSVRANLCGIIAAALFMLLLSAASIGTAQAQALGTGSTILGLVTDAQGAAVGGADILVIQTATGVSYKTKTNQAGSFELPALSSGVFTLAVKAAGFADYMRRDFNVESGQRLRVDVRLQLSTLKQGVEVTGTPTILNTEQGNTVHRISGTEVSAFPVFGNNTLLASRLVAGAIGVGNDDSYYMDLGNMQTPASVRYNGSSVHGNAITVDGTPATYGNGGSAFIPARDSVQEASVQTFALSAEYGATGGAVMAFETKSGTNQLHGLLGETYNGAALNSLDHFSREFRTPKAGSIINTPVVNLGGPILIPKIYNGKNRSFFFFNYEWLREKLVTSSPNVVSVPTAAMHAGDFSNATLPNGALTLIYDPLTTRTDSTGTLLRDLFPGNKIPGNRIDPIGQKIVNLYPLPNQPGIVNNYVYNPPTNAPLDSGMFRIDHHFTDSDFLSFTYGRNNTVTSAGTNPMVLLRQYSERYKYLHYSTGYTHVFNPSTVLVFRGGVSQVLLSRISYYNDSVRDTLGFSSNFLSLLQTPGNVLPNINLIDAVQTVGTDLSYPYHTISAQPTLSKMVGRHSLAIGYEFRVSRNFEFTPGNGSFSFRRDLTQGPKVTTSSTTAGFGAATALLGYASDGTVAFNAADAGQKTYQGLYLQDNWRFNSKLTLNLGLRWDYEGPMMERYNRMNRGFDLTTPSPIAVQAMANYALNPVAARQEPFQVLGGLLFAGVNGQSRGGFDQIYTSFMPRVGLAYQVLPKTVMRFGYGLFYSPMVLENQIVTSTLVGMPLTQNGFSVSTAMTAQLAGLPVNTLSNPYPQGIVQPTGSSLGLSTLLGQSVTAMDPAAQRPYTHQFQFGIQRELPSGILFDVAYVGNRAHRLPVSEALNWLQPKYLPLGDGLTKAVPNPFYGIIQTGTLSAATVSTQQLLYQYPQFTGLTYAQRSIGSTWYNALQVSASKRMSHGLLFLANFTWDKLMQQTAYLNNPGEGLARSLAYSASTGGDYPFAAKFSGEWDVPFGTKMRYGASLPAIVRYAAGNWKLGWVVSFVRGGVLGVTGSAQQIRPLQDVTPTESKWFDTGAFAQLPPYSTRTLGLATAELHSDGVDQYNLTASKNFPIKEKVNFRLESQFINAFNQTQYGTPILSITSTTFGKVTTQANSPRRVMFSGKLTF